MSAVELSKEQKAVAYDMLKLNMTAMLDGRNGQWAKSFAGLVLERMEANAVIIAKEEFVSSGRVAPTLTPATILEEHLQGVMAYINRWQDPHTYFLIDGVKAEMCQCVRGYVRKAE